MCNAVDSVPRMCPMPWQRGQGMYADSASAVVFERVAKPVLDVPLIFRALHVDEVDDDEAAEVAQTQLARDFIGRFEIGIEGGGLDVAAFGGPGGIDVDRDQRLGVVDDDRPA